MPPIQYSFVHRNFALYCLLIIPIPQTKSTKTNDIDSVPIPTGIPTQT